MESTLESQVKDANYLFFFSFLATCSPFIVLAFVKFLYFMGGCVGDFTVTSASTIQCGIPLFKIIVDTVTGFAFVAFFFGGLVVIAGSTLCIIGMIRKGSIMYRLRKSEQKMIQSNLDYLFILLSLVLVFGLLCITLAIFGVLTGWWVPN